jgi:hypothetical protein
MGRSVGGAWESVSMGNGSITVPWTTVERKVGSMVFGLSFFRFTLWPAAAVKHKRAHSPDPQARGPLSLWTESEILRDTSRSVS